MPDLHFRMKTQVLNFIEAEVCKEASGATMSSKSFQGLKEQAEGAAKDAANSLGQATQDAVNQITDASQKVIDKASKTAQDGVEKATGQAAEAMSGFGKKCGLKK
ncbi:adipogenesis regulatory factor isoform X1 [Anas acuta]